MMKFDKNLFIEPYKHSPNDKIYWTNYSDPERACLIDGRALFTFDKKTVFNATCYTDMKRLTPTQKEIFIKDAPFFARFNGFISDTDERWILWGKISPYKFFNDDTGYYEFKKDTPSEILEMDKKFKNLCDEKYQALT